MNSIAAFALLLFLFLGLGASADVTLVNMRVLGQRLRVSPFILGLMLGALNAEIGTLELGSGVSIFHSHKAHVYGFYIFPSPGRVFLSAAPKNPLLSKGFPTPVFCILLCR